MERSRGDAAAATWIFRGPSVCTGFPIYGPRGPGGVEIRNCGASGADATYCQDACGGYEGALPDVDAFEYRYYLTGKVSDLDSLPSDPKPDSDAAYRRPRRILPSRIIRLREYIHVVAAAESRAGPTRPSDASARARPTDDPARSRGVAATRRLGISTS